MKKVLVIIICIFLTIVIILTEYNNKEKNISLKALSKINDQIISYFQSDDIEYDNYSFNYIDERAKVIIVGLLDNSKEEQEKFKELVVNSEYIIFLKADFKYDENNNYNEITLN